MADIEMVIKIPEEVRNRLCFGVTYPKDIQVMCEALNNGIQLPKGHGRLIDADDLEPDRCGEWNGLYFTEDTYKQSTIDNAPTIIEADKAESEGKG